MQAENMISKNSGTQKIPVSLPTRNNFPIFFWGKVGILTTLR